MVPATAEKNQLICSRLLKEDSCDSDGDVEVSTDRKDLDVRKAYQDESDPEEMTQMSCGMNIRETFRESESVPGTGPATGRLLATEQKRRNADFTVI